MSDYPSDWPCLCGHVFEKHSRIDTINGGHYWIEPTCQIWSNKKNNYEDGCVKFTPIDNLSYVEMKANELSK